jgi:hypothetical protein
MKEYLFDVALAAAVRIKAKSADEAREMLKKAFDCADCNGGAWPNGDPILFEASLDEPDLANIGPADDV